VPPRFIVSATTSALRASTAKASASCRRPDLGRTSARRWRAARRRHRGHRSGARALVDRSTPGRPRSSARRSACACGVGLSEQDDPRGTSRQKKHSLSTTASPPSLLEQRNEHSNEQASTAAPSASFDTTSILLFSRFCSFAVASASFAVASASADVCSERCNAASVCSVDSLARRAAISARSGSPHCPWARGRRRMRTSVSSVIATRDVAHSRQERPANASPSSQGEPLRHRPFNPQPRDPRRECGRGCAPTSKDDVRR
jgi:hypothetical protein